MRILFDLLTVGCFSAIPVLCILTLIFRKLDKALVFTAGLVPIPFVGVQVFETGTGIHLGYCWFFVSLLFTFILALMLYFRRTSINWGLKDNLLRLCFGFGAGFFYWLIAFQHNISQNRVYSDLLWNVAHAAQLKYALQITDPHWYTENILHYHLLFHRAIAGISLVDSTNVLFIAMKSLPLFTSICMMTMLFSRLLSKRFAFAGLVVLAVLTIRGNNSWQPEWSFLKHMTGYAASTFFWSVPLLLVGIFWWLEWYRTRRFLVRIKKSRRDVIIVGWICGVLLSFTITYAKASSSFPLLALEAVSCVGLLIEVVRQKRLLASWDVLLSFSATPFGVLCARLLFFGTNEDQLSFGLERKADFVGLGGHAYLVPLAIMAVALLFCLFSFRYREKVVRLFFFASVLNIAVYFVSIHPGRSDFFFVFNAIFLSALMVGYRFKKAYLPNLAKAFVGLVLLCFILEPVGFSSSSLGGFVRMVRYDAEVKIDDPENRDLISLGEKIKPKNLVLFPYDSDDTFVEAALMQARFWNESFRFTPFAHTAINSRMPNYDKLEDPNLRMRFAKSYAFDEAPQILERYSSIVPQWEYILVRTSDVKRLRQDLQKRIFLGNHSWTLVALNFQNDSPRTF